MDETFEQVVERLAQELHEKVYVPNAMALGYILGPQANTPYENLPIEGKELMRRLATWAARQIQEAGNEAFAAGRESMRADMAASAKVAAIPPAPPTPPAADPTGDGDPTPED